MEEKLILDHGIVRLLGTFGSDEDIIAAARMSYNDSTKKTSDDRTLMRYLVRHQHNGPLEIGTVRFYLKIPIFVMRQFVRHRTASMNEVSARYSELPNEFYIPEIEDLGAQSETNKQGRQDVADLQNAHYAKRLIQANSFSAYQHYQTLLNDADVSREMARSVLPVNIYTELVWQANLRNFFHMLKLRMDSHAQKEIRIMANAMYDLVRPHFPNASQAFEDYILNARTLSAQEQILLAKSVGVRRGELTEITVDDALELGMTKREYAEFMEWFSALKKEN